MIVAVVLLLRLLARLLLILRLILVLVGEHRNCLSCRDRSTVFYDCVMQESAAGGKSALRAENRSTVFHNCLSCASGGAAAAGTVRARELGYPASWSASGVGK